MMNVNVETSQAAEQTDAPPPAAEVSHTDTQASPPPVAPEGAEPSEATAEASAPSSASPELLAAALAPELGPSAESEAPTATADASNSAPSPAAESAPVAEAAPAPAAPASESVEAPRPRVQLSPTVAPEQARPVPTIASSTPIAAVAPVVVPSADGSETASPELAEAEAVRADVMTVQPTSGPAELPRQAPLSADLEAEIAAAMAGAMQATAPTATPDAAPGAPASVVSVPLSEDQLQPGQRLKAKVQQITADDVFCDVGFRSPGTVPLRQFPQGKQPRIGEEFLVHVDQYDAASGVIQLSLPKATRKHRGGWEELSVGQVVECIVNKTNKGGLEVTVSNLRAFLPASQIDLGFIPSLDSYVGQKFAVEITEVNPAKRNLVVSRKTVLIRERKEAAATFWPKVDVGQQYKGTVKSIKDYGAFIDLGGVDGFLHIGEMSWTRVKHPSDLLAEGQQIDVVILSLDREKQKIGLGLRQLAQNPWANIEDRYQVGKNVTGKVTRVTDFGAFLELEPGVEGLVHISELDYKRVKKVNDVLTVGQEATVQVLEIVPDRQRISLSLKALKEKPVEPKDEDLSPSKGLPYERKRKEPLRGGTTSQSSGGLFGNPRDFQ